MASTVTDLLIALYDAVPSAAVCDAADRLWAGASPDAVLFVGSYFDDAAAMVAHLEAHGPDPFRSAHRRTGGRCVGAQLPAIRDGPALRWRSYCETLPAPRARARGATAEQSLRSDAEADSASPGAFGVCRRCGGSRLVVTTRQLQTVRRPFARGGEPPASGR